MKMRAAILSVVLLALSACGFHLRGHGLVGVGFAFHSIYVRAPAETPFVSEVKRGLEINGLEVKAAADQADLVLDIAFDRSDKQILALGATGHVQEYLLQYVVSLRAYDKQQQEWLPAAEIHLQRDFPYDDSQALAKEQEEALLYRDMRQDAVQQVLRRLSLAKPPHEAQ